jgi:hypothetical protein
MSGIAAGIVGAVIVLAVVGLIAAAAQWANEQDWWR